MGDQQGGDNIRSYKSKGRERLKEDIRFQDVNPDKGSLTKTSKTRHKTVTPDVKYKTKEVYCQVVQV